MNVQTATNATTAPAAGPRFDRRIGLPSGRSVVGGLLVAAAALGTFGLARAEPSALPPMRVVAARDLVPGHVLAHDDLTAAPVSAPADATLFATVDEAVGRQLLAPLGAGEVVQASALAGDAGAPPGWEVTLRLDPARALDGRLWPGEPVEVLATFGTGADAETATVAAGAVVLRVATDDSSLAAAGGLTVTLSVADGDQARQVVHAADTGALTLVRRRGGPGS